MTFLLSWKSGCPATDHFGMACNLPSVESSTYLNLYLCYLLLLPQSEEVGVTLSKLWQSGVLKILAMGTAWRGIMHILSRFLGGFPPNSWVFHVAKKKENDVKKGELEWLIENFLFEGLQCKV